MHIKSEVPNTVLCSYASKFTNVPQDVGFLIIFKLNLKFKAIPSPSLVVTMSSRARIASPAAEQVFRKFSAFSSVFVFYLYIFFGAKLLIWKFVDLFW